MISHLKRLLWPIVFFLLSVAITMVVGISRTNLEVVVFKFLIFCPSVALVHLTRKVMFPYIDLRNHLDRFTECSGVGMTAAAIIDSAVILSVFLFYVVCIYALTQAV